LAATARPTAFLLAALVLAAFLLAACGAPASGPPEPSTGTASSVESSQEPEPEPSTESTEPTTPATSSRESNPAISVARLPVGGASQLRDDDPTLQCAEVSWIVDNHGQIPRGTAVELTDVLFTPDVFEVVRGGCGTSQPNCVGYIFRSTAQRCDLLVRLVGTIPPDTGPSVGFAGLIYCPRNDSPACRAFVAAMGDQQQISVQLSVPPSPETT
jgi:hypothetical protein